MKPNLMLLKREIGRNIENPKTEVHFVVVDSEIRKDYPSNFVCKLPLSQTLLSGNSQFCKVFGVDSVPVAKKLLSKALAKESDPETKIEIGKRLKLLNPKAVVETRCRACGSLFEPGSVRGPSRRVCSACRSRMFVGAH